VIVARTLAPWPLWLFLWETLRPDALRGPAFTPVVVTLLVGSMVQCAARAADRSLHVDRLVALLGLSFVAALWLQAAASFTWYVRGGAVPGPVATALLGCLAGVVTYELLRRALTHTGSGPSARFTRTVDIVAHIVLFAAPWTGVVDVRGDGLPLPLLVGPLLAVRIVGEHDAPLPVARRGALPTWTVLGTVAAVVLLGAVLDSPAARLPSATVAFSVLGAAVSALLASIALAARAHRAARSLSGVVYEHRPDGIVLSVGGGTERVHVVPAEPRPGAALPPPDRRITFIDLVPGPEPGSPYRGAPEIVRARTAWAGSAEQLAAALLCRAWGWLAFCALTFAAGAYLLG